MNSCYRHPDRETGVSCQRCDRYICPDCATPGAVGYLCPEDAKDTIKIRKANFQKSITSLAPVTMVLIGINILVYFIQWLIPPLTDALVYFNVGVDSEYGSALRALTSGFAHDPSQIAHILFNMYSLFVLGTLLEPALGKLKFLLVYFTSMFGGVVAVIMFTPFGYGVYGASGAIFGLMGSYLVMLRSIRADTRQMLLIVGINVFLSFLPGIAWTAHFGGLAVGAAMTALMVFLTNPKFQVLKWAGMSFIVAFLASFFY